MWSWKDEIAEAKNKQLLEQQCIVIWWHDKSTFYANDHRKVYWIYTNEIAKPWAKGEGISLMVADLVSADYR